jgi:molybdopterin converting factor small subunit
MDVALHSAGPAEPPPEKDIALPLVKIPPPYRGPTAGRASVEVTGSTVRECLLAAAEAYPGLGELVLDADGSLHRFVTLFINGDEIARGDLDVAIRADDELEVLAAIAGG